jgi:orotate phosphoribosyltransferase
VSQAETDLLAQLRTLIATQSVARGDFTLSSGKQSSYYIDARRTTMTAKGLQLIGALGLQAFDRLGWAPAVVGGLTLGADPVAYAIARASCDRSTVIDAFSVRKAAKEHGRARRIEGASVRGRDVVVVEDVITTGASAQAALAAVRAAGGRPLGVLAVVDRLEGGRETLEADQCDVFVLLTVADLGLHDAP